MNTSARGAILLSAALALALVAGCATRKPVIDTQIVEKPVPVPCRIALPAECRESYALERVSEADDMVTINRALRAENEQRAACETRLKAAARACQ